MKDDKKLLKNKTSLPKTIDEANITALSDVNSNVESNIVTSLPEPISANLEINATSPSDEIAISEVATLPIATTLAESVKIISPGRMVAKRFFRSNLSIVGLVILIGLFLFSFIGPLISPYGQIEKVDVIQVVRTIEEYSTIIDGQEYTFYEIKESTRTILAPPSWKNWLGTDTYGYDVLTRLMYGGRVSLTLSFIVIFLETFVGVIFGGIAGYFGKWIDQFIMRIVDIFNCLPGLPILLIASSLLSALNVPAGQRIYYLMIILTFFGWAGVARLVRGQILSLREQEFMVAAEATGLSVFRKIGKHLIPNVMPQLLVTATLGLGGIILYESTLSYLGLGIPIPYAAWGTMISAASPSNGQEILKYYANLWIPPGVCIVLAVLAFNFIGDGLRDAFDPKMKK